MAIGQHFRQIAKQTTLFNRFNRVILKIIYSSL